MTDELIEIRGNYYPVIYCHETRDNWEFLCSFCNEIHKHGKGEGHRMAHCHNQLSIYAHTGYYLKLRV